MCSRIASRSTAVPRADNGRHEVFEASGPSLSESRLGAETTQPRTIVTRARKISARVAWRHSLHLVLRCSNGETLLQICSMSRRKDICLFTAGYEGLSVPQFLRGLKAASVEVLFDIRYRPQSRKPGFSKNKLAAACKRAGIQYVHDPKLGTPPDQMAEMRKAGGIYSRKLFRKYRTFLLKQVDSLEHASGVVTGAATCLLCYEADYLGCHRRVVAEELSRLTKIQVNHLSFGISSSKS